MRHETVMSGLRAAGARGVVAPTVLAFREADFAARFLAELRAPDWRERLAARQVATPRAAAPAVLEQPLHRAFNLVAVDARCLAPGLPRLDPAQVVSAGLVIRRLRGGSVEGWMRGAGGAPLGWRPVPAGALDPRSGYDPDAGLRRRRAEGRNAAALARLDRLPGQGEAASEDAAPLFPVPPDIAAATGTSLFWGFLPLASAETEPPAAAAAPPFAPADIRDRVPPLLRRDRGDAVLPPVAGPVTRAEMRRPEEVGDPVRAAGLRTLKSALTWLAQETGAFGDGPEAAAIRAVLDEQTLAGVAPAGFGAWLERAHRAYLLQAADAPDSLRMPDAWPRPPEARRDALAAAAFAAMAARWSAVAPLAARYPAGRTRYELRCFLRLEDCAGCPPRTTWSPPFAPFAIKPWYEGADAPPIQIELPPVGPAALRAMKPNVAFRVPPELQQHLDRIDLGNLLDGRHSPTTAGFGMICAFSIPIITLCAFIILQIFLALLNIVFQWLLWVRVCLPFPRTETGEEG